MSQHDTPLLDLPLIQEAQAQKHVTHNEALVALDALVQAAAADLDRTAPPPAPRDGDRHLVAAGATGAWAGRDGQLALFLNNGWSFHAPRPGWRVHVAAEGGDRVWDGAAWTAPRADLLGVNATADATNRLAVSAPATLLSHEGAGHRVVVNKADTADTASLLFQSGWSGRAEMGLAGSDDFAVKVSADGAAWRDGLVVEAATGAVRFPGGYGGTGSAAGAMGGQLVTISAERHTGFGAGDLMSIGNGAADSAGLVLPFAGRVVAATLSVGGGAAGTTIVAVALDRVAQAGFEVAATHSGGVANGVADFRAAPLAVAAGQAVNLVCTAGPGAEDCVGTVFVLLD